MNDQSTYARYLQMLNNMAHFWTFSAEAAAFDKLLEYGWIKPAGEPGGYLSAEWIAAYRASPRYDGCDHSSFYVLTTKGLLVVSPRENRAVNFTNEPPVPFAMTPDGKQVCIFMDVLASPAPFDVTTDGKQICLLSDYLDEMEAPQPA